ncbi:hypothetical protein PMAYCL1PPCAC_12615, partial [Pristionchus mayeri]
KNGRGERGEGSEVRFPRSRSSLLVLMQSVHFTNLLSSGVGGGRGVDSVGRVGGGYRRTKLFLCWWRSSTLGFSIVLLILSLLHNGVNCSCNAATTAQKEKKEKDDTEY